MNTYIRLFIIILAAMLFTAAKADDNAPPPAPIAEQDVLAYLEQVISWNHKISSSEQPDNARQIVLKDSLQQNSVKVERKSFDFARAEAIILSGDHTDITVESANTNDRHAKLLKSADAADQKVQDLQEQLNGINKNVRSRGENITAKRQRLESALELATAQRDLLKTMVGIYSGAEEGSNGSLTNQINNLARTIPEVASAQKPETKPSSENIGASASSQNASNSTGIFGLISDLLTISRKEKEVNELSQITVDLRKSNQDLRTSLRVALQDALKQGNTLGVKEDSDDAKNLGSDRLELDKLVLHYKQLSAAIVPLGESGVIIDSAIRNLKEWGDLLTDDMKIILRHLLFRLGILSISILIPIILSELARRVTGRYVQDQKLQKQLRIARQVTFVIVLAFAIILNFVTEFGSLATFVGFMGAGLAVALQTVLLSLVAHFFFFGRFGVRVGDRVSISGTTGDVVQVGMLRIYLMELIGKEPNLRPSGKIVAFPNSVLFSSTAFSKQIPGTDYIWNEMTFLIDHDINYQHAAEKIITAVEAVYGDYREAIAHQHDALQQSTRLSLKMPAPRGDLSFTDSGLAYVVQYPVISKKAFEVRERITSKLIETFKQEPSLKLIVSNPFKIETK